MKRESVLLVKVRISAVNVGTVGNVQYKPGHSNIHSASAVVVDC